MWDTIVGKLPSKLIILNACLSFFIPWILYRSHQTILKYANPPWKENDKNNSE
jgi:hypothetical protein